MGNLEQQVPLGLVLVFFQNWLKQQKWFPWVTYESARVNNLVAIVLTGLATLGLHTSHTGTFSAGGTLLITWPTGTVILTGLWHWAQQYALTKGSYTLLQGKLNPVQAQMPQAVTEVRNVVAASPRV